MYHGPVCAQHHHHQLMCWLHLLQYWSNLTWNISMLTGLQLSKLRKYTKVWKQMIYFVWKNKILHCVKNSKFWKHIRIKLALQNNKCCGFNNIILGYGKLKRFGRGWNVYDRLVGNVSSNILWLIFNGIVGPLIFKLLENCSEETGFSTFSHSCPLLDIMMW